MKKAIILDLDGTLVNTNTFTLFTLSLMRNLPTALPVAAIALKRKLRMLSHAEAKQRILAVATSRTGRRFVGRFVERLVERHLRDSVYSLAMEERQKGSLVILATAAPALYAEDIARYTGLDGCIATPLGGPENMGAEKARRVEEWLHENGARLEAVLTDHSDDLPLMRLASAAKAPIWLVRPSGNTLCKTGHLSPQVI